MTPLFAVTIRTECLGVVKCLKSDASLMQWMVAPESTVKVGLRLRRVSCGGVMLGVIDLHMLQTTSGWHNVRHKRGQ